MSEYTQGVCMDGAAILKDGEIMTIEEILDGLREIATARQEATAYRISLENLEASLPKVRADAVLSILEPPSLALNGDTYEDLIRRHAQKILEQGNE